MALFEYLLLGTVSLFAIINPLSTVPLFLAMTPQDRPAERVRMARFACILATGLLAVFAFIGPFLFQILGITMPAFKIAGGLILSVFAFEMLRSSRPNRLTTEETELATQKDDIAVSPLAVPLLCGPGAISTVILLRIRGQDFSHDVALFLSIAIVYLAAFLILKVSAHGAGWLNPLVLRVFRRLMGIVFLAVAVQFVLNGIIESEIFP
ncbi:MAG TPA: MarC family protein [Opitutales bacterium]|nr:MarC family protein [Opitutales bacterium]